MAIEPANLIQIQSRLQDPSVRNEDLLKYANNSNPEVPAFLALIEMNRRKQISDAMNSFNQSSAASIKDQVASELTQPNQIGVGAISNPFKANLTTAAPGVNLAGNPANVNMTQEPTGINPVANPALPGSGAIKPITGANGGLMSIPVGHFKEQSYAGGGIVAFSGGGKSERYPEGKPDPDQYTHDKTSRLLPGAAPDYGLIAAAPDQTDAERRRLMREEQFARMTAGHPFLESAGTSLVNLPTDETPAPPAGPKQTGFQGILSALPPVAKPTEKSLEELAAERKAVQKLAGVSEDPYADSKKRMAAMEARQGKINEDAGLARLVAQLSAFATADPAKGIGYAGAVSAQASQELEDKQNALRDKQETAQIEFARAVEKEENARRLKDADGIQAAQAAQEKAKFDYQKAEHDRGMLAAHIYQTDEYAKMRRDAAAQAAENKPTAEEKKTLKVQTTINAHPVVKAIADSIKQGTIEVGSAEYYQALRKINEIAKPIYKQAGLAEPEDIVGDIIEEPAKKPGWRERIFGGSKTPASTGKTVSFDQLPK